MLLGNRAIFGALSLNGDEVAARRGSSAMHDYATVLGCATSRWRIGHLWLGLAARPPRPEPSQPPGEEPPPTAALAGELSNGPDLALELTGSSRLAANPDRLLSAAYRAWGLNLFARLDGTFAAALWDEPAQRLLLTCDRRGDAHIYYRLESDRLLFSSWCQLLAPFAKGLDRAAAREFLRFLYISPPRTIHDGISRLAPGSYLLADTRSVTPQPLPDPLPAWSPADLSRRSTDDLVRIFEDLLLTAIRRRANEKAIAVFLSSGIDSATIAALCRRLRPDRVQAFTIGFDEPDLDETSAAAATATCLGLPHRVLSFGLDHYRQAFDLITSGFDQPVGDPASLPMTLAYLGAKDTADVFLDGCGSDSLFGLPIPRHLRFQLQIASRLPRPLRRALASALAHCPPIERYARLFAFDHAEELLITWNGWTTRDLESLLGQPVDFTDTPFYRTFRKRRSQSAQQLFDTLYFHPPHYERLEAAALAERLVGFPYQDPHVRAFVGALPGHFRMAGANTKVLLRHLHARCFPPSLQPQTKRYFNIPLHRLLTAHHGELIHEHLTPDSLSRHALVDPDVAAPWIRRFTAGDQTLTFKVWALLVLHAWLDAQRVATRSPDHG